MSNILYRPPEMDAGLDNLEDIQSHLETLSKEELRTFTVDGMPGLHHLATIPSKPEDTVKLDRMVKLLKNSGCDINQTTDEHVGQGKRATLGFTPLLMAIQIKNLQLVEVLLQNGAKLDVTDKRGFPPLHWAVFVGNIEIFRKLIEAGALQVFSNEEATGDVHPILHTAVEEGQTKIAKYLLQHKLVDVKQEAVYSRSHLLELNRHSAINQHFTPLARAVRMGRRPMIKMLLKFGAKVSGISELHHCILQGEVEIACLFVGQFSHEDLATDMMEDKWALQCLHRNAFRLETLTKKTIELINAYVTAGWNVNSVGKSTTRIKIKGAGEMGAEFEITLLHLACYFESLKLIKYLVKAGADVNAKTRGKDILYPLQVSILQRNWQSVGYLLANGADVHAVGGFKTVKNLEWVSEPGSRDVDFEWHFTSLELLLQLGYRYDGGMAALEEMLKNGIPPPERITFQRAVQGKCCEFVCKVVEQLCSVQNVKMDDLTWLPVPKEGGATEYVPSLHWLIQSFNSDSHRVRDDIAKVVDVMGRYGYDFTLKPSVRYEEQPLFFCILRGELPFPENAGLLLLETILKFDKVEVNVRGNPGGLNPVEYVIHDWTSSEIQKKTAAVGLLIRSGVDVSETVIGKGFKYFQGYLPMMQLMCSVGAKIEPDGFIPSGTAV